MRSFVYPMERLESHSKKSGAWQTAFICVLVCAFIMLLVGVTFYFLNQNNDVMPDASPGNPVENRPPPAH